MKHHHSNLLVWQGKDYSSCNAKDCWPRQGVGQALDLLPVPQAGGNALTRFGSVMSRSDGFHILADARNLLSFVLFCFY
jgi:hypothetical protein